MTSATSAVAEKELVGKRLSQFRKRAGFSQNELAAKLNITRSAISGYESGRLRLHDDLLIKISKELKISADDILGLKKMRDSDASPSLKFAKRFKKIAKLDYSKQKKILSTLDDLIVAAERKS